MFTVYRNAIVLLIMVVVVASECCGADPVNLDVLLKEYQAHGLPLPTKTAKLVKYNTRINHDRYAIDFELQAATINKKQIILIGTKLTADFECQEINPDVDSTNDLAYDSNTDFIHAIQCHSRGWDDLALFLYERSQSDDKHKPELNSIAWSYWMGQVTEPKIDRAPVAKRLNALIVVDKTLDTEFHRSLLKSLELSLVPSKAKPGSIESLVDALVDDSTPRGRFGIFRTSEQFWNLAKSGFDAVPILIESLDDARLTRATLQGFNNFPTRHLLVQDIAGDVLEALAGMELLRGNKDTIAGRGWLRRHQGWPVLKSDASKWWETAKKRGEVAYLFDDILPPIKEDERVAIAELRMAILKHKYSQRIPTLYRTVLETRPDVQSWKLAEALAQSKQSDKLKIELFLLASHHEDEKHRLTGLRFLSKLDPKSFNRILIETLEKLPEDVSEKYRTYTGAHFVGLAVES